MNPHTLRVARRSHDTHITAPQMGTKTPGAANLLRSDHHRIENIIIAGIIPGPNEPQKTICSFPQLKQLIDKRVKVIVFWGSFGPGIMPEIIIFSILW